MSPLPPSSFFRVSMLLPVLASAAGFSSHAETAGKEPLANLLHTMPRQPGTVLEVPEGTHNAKSPLSVKELRGTAEKPITIRAASRGKTTITGVAGFVLKNCEHVVIEGFVFENDADQQCVRLENCHYVRVTRNVFQPQERKKPQHWEHWVTVDGANSSHNRIDHNRFEKKVNRGSPIFVRGDDTALVCSQHDQVDHNHFRDIPYANQNGHETIRTGGNDLGASDKGSFTIIEYNLLERCSGEDEIMSLKSSDNIVRYNTLINCRGAICLRLGNRTAVEGNHITATESGPGFGGIKLYGFEHKVTGNYLSGLTGTRHEAPFSLIPGMYDTPATDKLGKAYDDMSAMPPTRCVITGNTWIDCAPLQFGFEKMEEKREHAPNANTFTKNLVLRTRPEPKKKPLVNLGILRDMQGSDNIAYDAGAVSDQPWAAWFRWEKAQPHIKPVKALTPADVGSDAP